MEKNNYLSIYAKSFNWAGFFLPKKTYSKCSNLYDFCRTLDNIADDGGETEIKLRRFLNFKDNFNNQEFQNPIIKNMWELMDEYNISKNIVYDLFDGVESDIKSKVKLTDLLAKLNEEKKKERNSNIALSVAAVSAVTVFGIILSL